MASNDKKSKTATESQSAAAAPQVAPAASKADAPGAAKAAPDATPTKDAGEKATPSGYSRGEGQKTVTQAYKDNWNAIFGKKTKKKR